MKQKHLVVMIKEPRPGRVKTRLGKEIGMVPAAWWFRHNLHRLLRRLRDPRWKIWLAVSPDAEGLQSRIWPRDLTRIPQGKGSLGTRMRRVFYDLPPGDVAIIGSDIPGIGVGHISKAFATLREKTVVFGPAPDGGYWLIGLARRSAPASTFLKDVRWSTEFALADTVKSTGFHSSEIGEIPCLRDVDTLKDLNEVNATL